MTHLRLPPLALGLCVLLHVAPGSGQTPPAPEEFSAIFANISNVGAIGTGAVTIKISRWTSNDEHAALMKVLATHGSDALARALSNGKSVGSIGTPQELPFDLRYSRQYALERGGRRIVLMSDRAMAAEERMSVVSRDYPLTWIDLRLDANGRGEGSMSLAVRLRLLGDVLGVEDYANQPARLSEVKKVK